MDDIKRYFPHSKCPCGAGLILDREPSYRHQVFDLPEVRYRVTEHQVYSGQCPSCGEKQSAHWPDSVPSGQMDAYQWVSQLDI